MRIAKSKIGKKVLAWTVIFSLVVSFTPTIGATDEDDDTINVENAVFPLDDDGLANDLAFLSHVEDDDIGNITINVWKKNALGNWEEYDDGETNETGELTFFNATSGEYMWDAYEGNNKIENEGGFAVIDTLYSVSHVGIVDDFDGDDDVDDFIAYIFENNETSEDGYVEIYDDDGNLFDYGYTDEELDNDFTVFLASNLDRGNYTHYIYEEYNGTLIQNGSFYSYGSSTTTSDDDYYEWFEDWDYDVAPSDTIKIYFDPDTSCDCALEVSISYGVYDNETGDFIEWGDGEHYEIYGTDSDWFDQSWVASENGSYDFYVYMIDDNGTLEDDFWIYDVYLEAGDDNGTEESDEWFEDRDYYVEPSDTINVEYNPDTDCYCEVRVWVYIDVYQGGNKIDTIADDYYIYYTDDDWFEQDWTAEENDTYDFKVVLFDGENGPDNYEDEYWIYDVYLGAGDNETEDYDEKFSFWYYYGAYDENDEHQWNHLIIEYDPDTYCVCEMNVYVEAIIWDENGDHVDYSGENHTIYNDNRDWFEIGLEVDEPGKYWFTVDLYDDEWNKEDSFNFSLIMSDEWFIDQFSQDGNSVRINLDPQTNYDGEIGTEYYLDVLRHNKSNDDWEYIYGDYRDAIITSSDNEYINFEWTAEEEGTYRFMVFMYDESTNMENMAEFETEIVMNYAPVIRGINTEQVFEGQMFIFEVDVVAEEDANLEFKWDMGDGTLGGGPWGLHDETILYAYQDDGEYVISVQVSDGNAVVEESFIIWVVNVNPNPHLNYDDSGKEGETLQFLVQCDDTVFICDVPEDTVTVTWSFPDGTQVEGKFAQYQFTDDGEFLVGVTAEDEDGGRTSKSLMIIIENEPPTFTWLEKPSQAQEGEVLDFRFEATDPGDDTIVFHIDFGDGTAPMITQDGNVSHRYADGSDFMVVVCAKDEDGGESCEQLPISVDLLEQLEEEGLLPGFNLLLAISVFGVVGILRRRTH